jgi:GTPase SAR1 family protein
MEEIHVDNDDLKIVVPFSLAVCGPTSCGKTYWVYQFLKGMNQILKPFDKIPRNVLFCYSIQQSIYNVIRTDFPFISFMKVYQHWNMFMIMLRADQC